MPYGQNAKIGIIFQTSWDAASVSVNSAHWLPIVSESIGKNIPELLSEAMEGRFEEGQSYEGPHTNDGDVSIEAAAIPLGVLLSCVLEQTAMTTSGSVYTRTFRPRADDWDSKSAGRPWAFYKDLGVGSAMLYRNMNGSGLELSIANGELVKAKMMAVGGSFTQQAATSSTSYPTARAWTWDTVSASFGGTAVADIEQLTIKLDEAIEARHTLNNSKLPSQTKHTGSRVLTVEGTIKFNSQDEFQAFLGQEQRRLLAHMVGGTLIQSGYYESLTVDIPAFQHTEFKPVASAPGEITVGFVGKGKYHAGSGTLMAITHRSNKAAY